MTFPLLAAAFLALAASTPAQEWVKLPPDANLLPAAPSLAWQPYGKVDQLAFSWRKVEGKDTLRIAVTGPRPDAPWGITLSAPIAPAVRKGELLYLRFRVRCLETHDETGAGILDPVVQYPVPPHWEKEIDAPISVPGKEWMTFAVRRRVRAEHVEYTENTLKMIFRLGFAAQTLEIQDLELYRLPADYDEGLLPVTPPPSYAGREADAAWRKEADERIDRFRKQDVKVAVTDEKGNPVPGAAVHVEQQRHAFRFGTAIDLPILTGQSPDSEKYRAAFREGFNSCETENDLKWSHWLRPETRAFNLKALAELHGQGVPIRGTTLYWPSYVPPAVLEQWKGDPDGLRKAILDHVRDEASATAPFLRSWNVLNEPTLNNGPGGAPFLGEVFQAARQAAPNVELYVNELISLSNGGTFQAYLKLLQELADLKAPFDGIGAECHYGGWTLTPPAQIVPSLDALGKFGKDVEVTEFDVDTTDEQLKADYVRDFYTVVFSHPAVTGIQMWGFWEGRHWKPAAALWKKDWTLLPAGRAYLDLVKGKWWTKADGTTDAQGAWAVRAFKGTQRVTVQWQGRTVTRDVEVGDQPAAVAVELADK